MSVKLLDPFGTLARAPVLGGCSNDRPHTCQHKSPPALPASHI